LILNSRGSVFLSKWLNPEAAPPFWYLFCFKKMCFECEQHKKLKVKSKLESSSAFEIAQEPLGFIVLAFAMLNGCTTQIFVQFDHFKCSYALFVLDSKQKYKQSWLLMLNQITCISFILLYMVFSPIKLNWIQII
jgi:hypothetical protein